MCIRDSLCLVDLGFAAGESPTHKLAAVFQIVNALAHPADIGVVVRQQKRGIRLSLIHILWIKTKAMPF